MGFARRLTRPRIAEFHRGLALLLSLVRYPETFEARPWARPSRTLQSSRAPFWI